LLGQRLAVESSDPAVHAFLILGFLALAYQVVALLAQVESVLRRESRATGRAIPPSL
jgi:hypothetical protein